MSNMIMAKDRTPASYLIRDYTAEASGYPNAAPVIAEAARQDAEQYLELIDSIASCNGDFWQIAGMSGRIAEFLLQQAKKTNYDASLLAVELEDLFLCIDDASN